MKRYLIYICISLGFLFTECEKSDEYVASPQENFEALWKILDENYCFFEYKDIDWNEVHDRYKTQISDTMNQYVLFDVLGDMLNELKDGHTNLISTFNMSRYWDWYLRIISTRTYKRIISEGTTRSPEDLNTRH